MYNKQLDIFLCVAENGSFTSASEKLYISSTAVMKQINALEHNLGVVLFERTMRGVKLTAAGTALVKYAHDIIQLSEKSIHEIKKIAENSRTVIRVGSSLLNPCKYLMELWQPISDSHPNFRIQIVPYDDNYNNENSIIETLGQKIDLIVAPCDSNEWQKSCHFLELGQFDICCAVPYSHSLVSHKTISLNDLKNETLIMMRKGDSQILDQIRNDIMEQHPYMKIIDSDFYDIEVFNQCEEKKAVLLTLSGWAEIHPALVTIPLEGFHKMPYGLLYSKNASDDINFFIDLIKEEISHQQLAF
ncbi:MAG: LysR family transcriptional regulator [Lachnospiraceae bacterium]